MAKYSSSVYSFECPEVSWLSGKDKSSSSSGVASEAAILAWALDGRVFVGGARGSGSSGKYFFRMAASAACGRDHVLRGIVTIVLEKGV